MAGHLAIETATADVATVPITYPPATPQGIEIEAAETPHSR
jgi:hypothetical protein